MRKLVLFLLCTALCFTLGYQGAKFPFKKTKSLEEVSLKSEYQPAEFVLKNHPFVVVVVGYNNGATVEKTLSSLFFQNYPNFRLIYIDDASTDGSGELARDYVNRSDQIVPVNFVQNEKKLGELENIFRAVKASEDHEIIVVLQGEDWLAHEWVLQRLNAYYRDPDLWLLLGSYINYPTFQKSPMLDLQAARSQPVSSFHLKSFYAKLFKQIREGDFIYGGQFLSSAAEIAYMTPMREIAKDHFYVIPEILSIHNKEAVNKEDREEYLRCEKFIRGLDSYEPLETLEIASCGE